DLPQRIALQPGGPHMCDDTNDIDPSATPPRWLAEALANCLLAGQITRATRSSTIETSGASVSSCSVNPRPATSLIPSVEKYSGVTVRVSTLVDRKSTRLNSSHVSISY